MFLGRRSAQAEYFDLPGRSATDVASDFRGLDRINRFFQFARPFQEKLPVWLGAERCNELNILDVGAGSGLLAQTLSTWAARRDWQWNFTNLDANAHAARFDPNAKRVVGCALKLPFPDHSFDLVIASQMTHHLTDDEVVTHFREAWRVTRDAVMISDMHRNLGLHAALCLLTPMLGVGGSVRADALVSVRRGFRCAEFERLARTANLGNIRVKLYYGARILLFARKTDR